MEKNGIMERAEKLARELKCTKNGKFYILESNYFDMVEKNTPDFLMSTEKNLIQDFNENFDNIESKAARKVGFIDLYEEEFHDLNEGEHIKDETKAQMNDSFLGELHVLMSPENNVSPLHLQICLYPVESVPQVLGSEVFEETLNIFLMIDNQHSRFPSSKHAYLGYNSLCAGAEMNQLHLEFLDIQSIKSFEDFSVKKFPVEKLDFKEMLESSLYNKQEACNLFECGMKISARFEEPRVIKLSPSKLDIDPIHIFKSLSFVSGLFMSQFLANSIPHNLLACKQGYDVYLFPRGDDKHLYGWLEVFGLPRLKKLSEDFNSPDEKIWSRCSLDEIRFRKVLGEVVNSLKTKFD